MSFGRETQVSMLAMIFLSWLRRSLSTLLIVCTLRRFVLVILARNGVLEIRDEAVEGFVKLIEERHAATLLRGALLLGVLRRMY